MAQETKRGCGYRKVGGLYLCGEYRPVECDRLPYPLDTCPICGAGIKPSRSYTKIAPETLFGAHFITARTVRGYHGEQTQVKTLCGDNPNCYLCLPKSEPAFVMTVGGKHYETPETFLDEAHRLGISKRIPFIPKELELGKTVVYLAHPKACRIATPVLAFEPVAAYYGDKVRAVGAHVEPNETPDATTEQVEYKYGIFTAFVPQRVEKLIWRHQATEDELASLAERGITPVVIENGDIDHAEGV